MKNWAKIALDCSIHIKNNESQPESPSKSGPYRDPADAVVVLKGRQLSFH